MPSIKIKRKDAASTDRVTALNYGELAIAANELYFGNSSNKAIQLAKYSIVPKSWIVDIETPDHVILGTTTSANKAGWIPVLRWSDIGLQRKSTSNWTAEQSSSKNVISGPTTVGWQGSVTFTEGNSKITWTLPDKYNHIHSISYTISSTTSSVSFYSTNTGTTHYTYNASTRQVTMWVTGGSATLWVGTTTSEAIGRIWYTIKCGTDSLTFATPTYVVTD